MKTEHFIYKSDGCTYMQNVPNKPKLTSTFEVQFDRIIFIEKDDKIKRKPL